MYLFMYLSIKILCILFFIRIYYFSNKVDEHVLYISPAFLIPYASNAIFDFMFTH